MEETVMMTGMVEEAKAAADGAVMMAAEALVAWMVPASAEPAAEQTKVPS